MCLCHRQTEVKNGHQILLLFLNNSCKLTSIPQNSSENHSFSDELKQSRKKIILLNLLNVRKEL